MAAQRTDRASLAIVYTTVFLDLLGFGIILPSLPYFARTLGASGFELGLLFTAYSLAQLFGASILGRFSDRVGRRPVLLLSLAGSAIAMTICGLVSSLWALCAARAVAGLFGGSIATAQAYIADVTTPEDRARAMGMLGASIGVGFVAGPLLGVAINALGGGFSHAAFVAAGLAVLNLASAAVRLAESRPAEDRRPRRRRSLLGALTDRDLGPSLAALFLATFAFVGMETTFAFLGADRFGLDEHGFGLVLVYVGVIVILVQGGLVGRLSRRFGVRAVAMVGSTSLGVGLIGVPWGSFQWALLCLGLLAVGQALTTPTLSTLVSIHAGRDEQGGVLGLGQSLSAGARAFGPVVAGALYDRLVAGPYLLAGAAALVAAVLVAKVRMPAASS